MTVAHDAATKSSQWDATPDPFTYSHTPVGTPRGVLVWVIKDGTGNGAVTGITYGGVAMTRVTTNGYAADTAGEPGSSFCYFLGASIPTGVQTVSVDHTAGVSLKVSVCCTVTAAADTEVLVSDRDQEDQANPSAALDTSAAEALRYAGIYSGQNDPTSLVLLSNMTAVHTHDFGTFSGVVSRQTTASTGSFTIGWTVASDDVAANYVAVQEVAGDATVTPAVIAVTVTLPTPTIAIPAEVVPAVIPVTASLPTPTIAITAVVTPAVIPVVVALPTPTVQAASTVEPAVIPVTVTLPTPITVVSAVASPAVIAVTVSLPTPAVLAASKVLPAVIPVTVSLPTPTIEVQEAGVVTPATIAVSVSLPTPTITSAVVVTPAGITVVMMLPTPAVSTPGVATPAGISLVVTVPTPLATVGAITFWSPNPVLYDPIGAGDEPPWN